MNLISRLYRDLRSRIPTYGNDDQVKERVHRKATTDFEDPELAGYYANLEIPYGSDIETVRRAWKRLLRKYHPDLHSNDPQKRQVANELTQGLNRAYEKIAEKLENDTQIK